MKRIYFSAAILLMIPLTALGIIKGTVEDIEGKKLAGASVELLSLPDSLLVDAAITDQDGNFIFERHSSGNMLLASQLSGFEPTIQTAVDGDNVIRMNYLGSSLDEVSIEVRRGVLESQAGKYIYTPGEMARSMPNAYEALRITPLITAPPGGDDFSIFSKSGNALIYINGRLPKQSNAEIMAMLRRTPPKNIRKIEIITDPGATVSGEFNGGIINIDIQLPDEGYVGQVTVGASSSFESAPTTGSSLFVGSQFGKFHSSFVFRYGQGSSKGKSENIYDYTQTSTILKNNTHSSGHYNSLLFNFNMFYDITEKSLIGLSAQTFTYEGYSRSKTRTTAFTPDGESDSYSKTRNVTPFKRPEIRVTAYYTLNLDNRGSYLDFETYYSKVMTGSFRTLDLNNSLSREDMADRFRQAGANFTLKKNFADIGVLEAGGGYVNFNPSLRKSYLPADNYSEFSFYMNDLSAYAQFSRQFSNVFSAFVGLRWEYNNYHMRLRPFHEEYKNHYGDFLPTVRLNFNFGGGRHQLGFGYFRRVTRPTVYELNPLVIMSTDNTGSTGDPHLKSYTSDYLSMQYVLLQHFYFMPSIAIGTNRYTGYVTDNNITITKPMTGGHRQNLDLTFGYISDFFSRWNLQAAMTPVYQHVSGLEISDLNFARWTFEGSIQNTVRLTNSDKFFATLNYTFNAGSHSPSSNTDASHIVDLSLTMRYPKGHIILGATNLLNSRPKTHFNSPGYAFSSRSLSNGTSVYVSFQYNFGNMRVKAAQSRIKEM